LTGSRAKLRRLRDPETAHCSGQPLATHISGAPPTSAPWNNGIEDLLIGVPQSARARSHRLTKYAGVQRDIECEIAFESRLSVRSVSGRPTYRRGIRCGRFGAPACRWWCAEWRRPAASGTSETATHCRADTGGTDGVDRRLRVGAAGARSTFGDDHEALAIAFRHREGRHVSAPHQRRRFRGGGLDVLRIVVTGPSMVTRFRDAAGDVQLTVEIHAQVPGP